MVCALKSHCGCACLELSLGFVCGLLPVDNFDRLLINTLLTSYSEYVGCFDSLWICLMS